MISISWAASAGTGPSHKSRIRMAISPDAIARSIAFAVEQPADVDVGKLLSAL
jgi:NADP-dependent 3-hydroxy acid dehydrogenase YdfG